MRLRKLALAGALLCAAPAAAQSGSGSASAPLLVTAEVVPSCVIDSAVAADTSARVSVYCGAASRLRVRRGAQGPLESPVVDNGRMATARVAFPIDASRPPARREPAAPAAPSGDVLIVLEF